MYKDIEIDEITQETILQLIEYDAYTNYSVLGEDKAESLEDLVRKKKLRNFYKEINDLIKKYGNNIPENNIKHLRQVMEKNKHLLKEKTYSGSGNK